MTLIQASLKNRVKNTFTIYNNKLDKSKKLKPKLEIDELVRRADKENFLKAILQTRSMNYSHVLKLVMIKFHHTA